MANPFCYIYFTLLILFYLIKNTNGATKKTIKISNTEIFTQIVSIYKDNYPEYDELEFNFVDSYYDMTLLDYAQLFTINRNLTFMGNENGTVFDFKNKSKGIFRLNYNLSVEQLYTVTFENIIFKNYDPQGQYIFAVEVTIAFDKIKSHVEFNNCTFEDNDAEIVLHKTVCSTQIQQIPQIEFNKCNF